MTASGGAGMVCAKCGMTGMSWAVTVNGLIVCDWCKPKMSTVRVTGTPEAHDLFLGNIEQIKVERDLMRGLLIELIEDYGVPTVMYDRIKAVITPAVEEIAE